MATRAELITALRKEMEDLFTVRVSHIFMIQYGTISVTTPSTAVTFTQSDTDTGEETKFSYEDTDYEIYIYSAMDANNIDIKAALTFTKTLSGFTIHAPRNCTVRWQVSLRTPRMYFFT